VGDGPTTNLARRWRRRRRSWPDPPVHRMSSDLRFGKGRILAHQSSRSTEACRRARYEYEPIPEPIPDAELSRDALVEIEAWAYDKKF
jgi:hypothetical protein